MPVEFPDPDLRRIIAPLWRLRREYPDLYEIACEGVRYVCREVGYWAPKLEAKMVWLARIPYSELLFDIEYGWREGRAFVFFRNLARWLPERSDNSSIDLFSILDSKHGVFFHMGFSILIPNDSMLVRSGCKCDKYGLIIIIIEMENDTQGHIFSRRCLFIMFIFSRIFLLENECWYADDAVILIIKNNQSIKLMQFIPKICLRRSIFEMDLEFTEITKGKVIPIISIKLIIELRYGFEYCFNNQNIAECAVLGGARAYSVETTSSGKIDIKKLIAILRLSKHAVKNIYALVTNNRRDSYLFHKSINATRGSGTLCNSLH